MDRKTWGLLLGIIGWLILFLYVGGGVAAQEDVYEVGHEDVFGKLERPPVVFPHGRHMDALEQEGCGFCHHVFDEDAGALVPVDDPVTGCTECHGAKKEDDKPALRQAFHGSCTVCHRDAKKTGQASPPVTCGECHKKRTGAGQER
jgi:hypothetical protein